MMLKGYTPSTLNFPTPRQHRPKNIVDYIPACQSPRVIINVSGMRYETYEETLGSYPDTLLGSPTKRSEYYNPTLHEFVFARDKPSFDAILFFYQSRGILAKPDDVREDTFLQEIDFYGIDKKYYKEDLYDDELSESQETIEAILPHIPHKRRLWLWFEYPRSSAIARALALWSILVIAFSTVIFCIETLPELQIKPHIVYRNVSTGDGYKVVESKELSFDYWFVMEGVCVAWFTLEYLVRLYSAPSPWNFAKTTMGILDILAILPFYFTLTLEQSTLEVRSFAVLYAIRLFRVLRVFKLSRYSAAMKLLVNTLYCSLEQLRSLGFCFCVTVILFSSAIFEAEDRVTITSIPDGFWWTVITMTSVGYGDVIPLTTVGKFVGCFCAMSGVAFFCLPTPVLVSNFIKFYLSYGQTNPKKKDFAENLKQLFLRPQQ